VEDLIKAAPEFSERDFYLAEFRGRTLAIALRSVEPAGREVLSAVLGVLAANSTRVVLLSPDADLLESLLDAPALERRGARWPGLLWHSLRETGQAGLVLGEDEAGFARACHEVALRLGFAKLVWVDDLPSGSGAHEQGLSYVDRAALEALMSGAGLSPERLALLAQIHAMIAGGIPAVNVCRLEGLAEELFTYAGSGTLFTRDGYTVVRDLGIHEFDAAQHLMARGLAEGYLVERSQEQQEAVLSHAFGVFVEDRYLAGIGALLPHEAPRPMGEVASLYTVTRFVGEGVGRHLLRHARERASHLGMESVFACTASEAVENFFIRNGFERVGPEAIPEAKWKDYPEARRRSLRCVRFLVEQAGGGL